MFKLFCWMILLYSNVQCLELKSRTSSKKVMYVLLCEQKLLFLLIIFNIFWRHRPTNVNMSRVHLAVVMPHSFFNGKEYQKKMYAATNSLSRLEFKVRYIKSYLEFFSDFTPNIEKYLDISFTSRRKIYQLKWFPSSKRKSKKSI